MTASQLLTIEVQTSARGQTLVVAGELDLATAPQLREEILRRLPVADTLFLDLGGVSFMDSSGLHALIASQRRATLLDRQVVLTRASPIVERLLVLTGTSPMFVRRAEAPRESALVAQRHKAAAEPAQPGARPGVAREPSR